jgi:aminoglycoside 3-N-acetyltransferase I
MRKTCLDNLAINQTGKPMDIQISKLSSQNLKDFQDLINVFEAVFEMDDLKVPGEEHLQQLLDKPGFFSLVAKDGAKVVGGLTVYILQRYYSTKQSAYIYDFGVMPQYQRKGIGKKLFAYLVAHCKEHNFEDVYVQAESGDSNAVNFYRQLNFSNELRATQFTYSFTPGAPGL